MKSDYNGIKTWRSTKVETRKSNIVGMGEFAIEDIKKDEIVFVKGGHIITRKELSLFEGAIDGYWPISDDLMLAAKTKEEFPQVKFYANSSCEPNCGLRGEITLVAMRNIKKGEELTFDYAMLDNEDNQFECRCGSKSCRKIVTGYDWKRKDLQEKYGEYFAEYLKQKIKK